jgi:hypothetical protein
MAPYLGAWSCIAGHALIVLSSCSLHFVTEEQAFCILQRLVRGSTDMFNTEFLWQVRSYWPIVEPF